FCFLDRIRRWEQGEETDQRRALWPYPSCGVATNAAWMTALGIGKTPAQRSLALAADTPTRTTSNEQTTDRRGSHARNPHVRRWRCPSRGCPGLRHQAAHRCARAHHRLLHLRQRPVALWLEVTGRCARTDG